VVTPPAPIRPKFVQQNYATPQTPQSQVSAAYLQPQTADDANILAIGWNDTSASSGPLTLSATNALLFGAGMTSTTFAGPGLGFTARVITSPDGDLVEDQVAGTLGPFSATAPLGSGSWLMQLAAFKPALPPTPALRLVLTPTNTVIATWQGAGFRLQENPGLATGGWSEVTNTAGSANGENQVVLTPLFSQRFYRLKYP
jgi:hypothetical protein